MADIQARVLVDLANDTDSLVDITSRCTSVTGSYGRRSNLFDYRTGTASIQLSTQGGYLVPGLGGSTYSTVGIKGRKVQVDARVVGETDWECVFVGTVDLVRWQPTQEDSYATIVAIDGLEQLAHQTVTLPDTTPSEQTGGKTHPHFGCGKLPGH